MKRILVLLYKFSDSPESIFGYQLCQKLVEDGYHLYVTTTTPEGAQLKAERRKAEQLNQKRIGDITLLEPQYDKEYDNPTSEWIANNYERYFGYIADYDDIKTIIGMLPGTTKTAIELKEILNCKLVFLVTNKVEGLNNGDELKEELIRVAEEANEIWCVGPDVHAYYQAIFKDTDSSDIKCQSIMLQPSKGSEYYWQVNASKPQLHTEGMIKFLSVWKNSFPFYYMGRRKYSTGTCLPNYCTLSSALGQINARGKHRNKVQWNIHGLRFQDKKTIEDNFQQNTMKLYSLSKASSVEKLTWKNCPAYIDPDIYGDSINYLALSTLWLGIPTIVSKTSATGIFLQQVECAQKALVELSGDSATDVDIWRQKIYKDILNEDAKPMLWAKEISEYFQNTAKLWEIDLSVLRSNEQRLSGGSISSYITAREQPHPDVVAKVQPWLHSTKVNRSMKSKLKLWNIHYIDKQSMLTFHSY